MIHVGFISTMGRLREVDQKQVAGLAESIKEVGLLNPITVYPREIVRNGQAVDGYGLVAGAHRLEACKSLGWQEIPAVVSDLGEQERTIAECDENLCGPVLTASERAMFTARRKEAYLVLHPETAKPGPKPENCGAVRYDPFADDQSRKTGRSSRSIREDAERGEKISPAAVDILRGTRLDTGKYLDTLKGLEHAEQVARVKADLAARERQPREDQKSAKIDADVKSRAATEVAEIIAENVPGEWWDAVKANLYAAGAKNVADALSNITGQSIMDRRHA